MTGRYPDYDWRGIAMLTQQLGQLFEPSKARLMSQQQDHEMNMLMAKQAWDTQSEDLTALKLEYKGLTADLDTATKNVNDLGLRQLTNAGRSDGTNVEERYRTNGGTTDYEFTAGFGNETEWTRLELKPATPEDAKSIYSCQLRLTGSCATNFMINDISFVYRVKGIK